MRELALFAGVGGGILGGKLLGWRTVCAVEIDSFCRSVLLQRQLDGCIERFPIWDDVRTFDGRPWRGAVDVISGGFPCQDISSAGRREGITGARSGLWSEFARIISEVRPKAVLVENSPHLRTRGLEVILEDLASLGFDARWGVLGDCHAGGATIGSRMWLVATPNGGGERTEPIHGEVAKSQELDGLASASDRLLLRIQSRRLGWALRPEAAEHRHDSEERRGGPCISQGKASGLADRVDRTRATGNGKVASLAALAWCLLGEM
jgi:DNA (cytosine-5)-methyltransferase 1